MNSSIFQFKSGNATVDIGEPLGTVANNLRQDRNGIDWWGYLDAETPEKPT